MKNNLQHSANATGRRYWRSLDELADTPEFKDWLHREFPKGASEFTDDVSRRHFLKIMSASFALAGLGLAGAGCRRPEEKLEPFGKQPDDYVYGKSEYFATAMPTRNGAIPLVVKSYEGRPIKIEGNALYPGGNGGTDRYAQASILNLYDPDRARHFKQDGKIVSRDEALKSLDDLSAKFSANQGEGLAFLAESNTSPSRARLQKLIAQKFPQSKWFTYDAIDSGIHQRAATKAFGQNIRPVYHFDKAKVILSLDCDFIGGEDDCHNHIRKFIAGRKPGENMNRLYAVESLFTLTGANADHRLRIPASLVGEIAKSIANYAGVSPVFGELFVGDFAKSNEKWISECAKDLVANHGNVLVVAGQRQPIEVHLLAHAMNVALGAIGNTVTLVVPDANTAYNSDGNVYRPTDNTTANANGGTFSQLSKNLDAGIIDTLVILGGNPTYISNWPLKPKTVVRLGYYEDETSEKSDWNFPAAHYLESWGDARTSDGTLVAVQPLIQPLFGGMTELEFLARTAGESQTNSYDIVQETFRQTPGAVTGIVSGFIDLREIFEESWKKFLFNGFGNSIAASTRFEDGRAVALPSIKNVSAPTANNLEVIFYRDAKVDDGRYANNGWMQELPDPVTKITWDNAVLVSRKTARELGVANGDVVEISLNEKKVSGPIWTQPGMADYSLGLALGYGRERAGRVGTGVGFNAYKIFSGKYIETGATIRKTGGTHVIATTQTHWSMEGRPAVREANLEEFQKVPGFAQKMHTLEPPIVKSLYPNPFDEAKKTALHQWGMVVDLSACVGCSTCVVACQSENNIPIVGKDQVNRGREMHWMRIDRYYTADPKTEKFPASFVKDDDQQFSEWIDDVQAVNQPVMCQMCEAAPCENVCPVNATVHDNEGLNVMAYNRCIGTRYCSNNCPYKVRHFNFLDYNKRPLSELKGPYYSTPILHKTDGEWDLARWWKDREAPMRSEEEWDLIKLSKNPDVTVRMRGVMEKCTYCTQRIEQAKIAQKVKAGASGDVRLSEAKGTVPKTACQQACPAQAIMFGDISDPDSTVSKLKTLPQNYLLLGDLLTKPRTSYLARIRNPNPAVPDYHAPYSTEEHDERNGVEKGKQLMAEVLDNLKSLAPPPELRRSPNIIGNRGLGYLTDKLTAFNEGKTPLWWWVMFFPAAFCATVVLPGILIYKISTGVGVWGNNHPVMWGWDIINFVWWVGVAHAGTLISAMLFLTRQHWRTAIGRAAEAMTVFSVMMAGLYPGIHVGRSWFDWFMFPVPTYEGMWPQFRSPLMWDVFAVNTYLIVSTTFWYMGLIPDLALLRDRSKTRVRKFIYGLFALGWTGSARHWHNYEKAYTVLAGLCTLLVFTVSSIVGMDFATSQIAGWHATIFPLYFVVGAVYCGFGMILVLLIPLRKLLHLENIITQRHIDRVCKLTLLSSLAIGYIYLMEYFIAWYSGDPYERWVFSHRLLGTTYWYGGWIMILVNVGMTQLLWFKKTRANLKLVFCIAVLINCGMWFERFVIIVGSLYQDFLPANWGYYKQTWVDVLTFVGTLGVFFMMYLLFIRFVPMVAVSEVKGITPEADPHHPRGGAEKKSEIKNDANRNN